MKMENIQSSARSMTALDTEHFTIIHIEKSKYEDQDAVQFKTKETFEIDDQKFNEFYTTRVAIVSALSKDDVIEAVNNGDHLGPVHVKESKTKKGKSFFVLADYDANPANKKLD